MSVIFPKILKLSCIYQKVCLLTVVVFIAQLSMLVQGVLYCLLEPLSASINPLNDHWGLRDYAARLLAQITHSWSDRVGELEPGIMQTLQDAFLDPAKPFCSHYGAVMGLTTLGTQVGVHDTAGALVKLGIMSRS